MDRIICIAGPTASGKTELSLYLAEQLHGEIISCDSMQVYKRMDIGTAKPSMQERRGIIHHMMDVAEPWEEMSAGRFTQMADPILQDILSRGKTAILAGGTGLYMDSLIRGNDFAPIPATGVRERLQLRARQEGTAVLLEELRAVDPQTAARLHLADEKRIIRALEVYLEAGKTITAHNEETQKIPPKYEPCWIGLNYVNREDLYNRINLRVDKMLEAGLMGELEQLLAEGIPEGCTALQAIGYKEFIPVLRGQRPLEAAAEEVKQSSRRYAKRQLTWFRRNKAIGWIYKERDTEFSKVSQEARRLIPFFD